MSPRCATAATLRRPRPRSAPIATLALALALPAFATSAGADWLVTTDGERIETRGAWKVEGRRVLFHLPNGTLTALRVEQVDLDQSRRASAEQPQAPAPPAGDRTPVLVLTDENVGRASEAAIRAAADPDLRAPDATEAGSGTAPGGPAGDDSPAASRAGATADVGDGDGESAESAATAPSSRQRPDLEVSSWREETVENGFRFVGTLDNGSPDFATLLTVEVALYDETGALIDTRPARLASRSLAPGANTTFDVTFDGVYSYGDAVFTPDGRTLRARPPAAAPGSAEPAGDEGEEGATVVLEVAPEAASEPPPGR